MFDKNSWQLEDITFVLNEYANCLRWGYKDESVLHFGCGSGFITDKFLLPHLPLSLRVVGVEDDLDLVNFAKKYHAKEQVEYRRLKEIQDSVFDHILSFYYFNQNFDELELLHMLNKHLSPNGDLMMIFLNEHSILNILDKLMESISYEGKLNKVQRKIQTMTVSNQSLVKTMSNNGFSQVICKCYERYHIFPNKSVLKTFLKTNLIGRQFIQVEFKEFFNDFMELMLNQCSLKRIGRNGNVLALPYKMTVLYAKKYCRSL